MKNPKIEVLKELWSKDYACKALIPAVLLLAATLKFHLPILGALSFVLIFSIFDVLGFTIADGEVTVQPSAPDVCEPRAKYRVVQAMMHVVLIALVWNITNWKGAIAGMTMWWFVVCDRIFYALQKQELYDESPWLYGWSFFGILRLIGIRATPNWFNAISIIGLIAGTIVAFL